MDIVRPFSDSPTAPITVDTDKRRLDVAMIHRFLSGSYWARGIPLEVVERSITGSLCFGLFEGERQVGFARVVSDGATFAYLADVFILEECRGRGHSKALMAAVLAHPSLQGLRRWLLATRDAHDLYAQFGFAPLQTPQAFMQRHDPDVYVAAKDEVQT